jgi:group I intron endonuclease
MASRKRIKISGVYEIFNTVNGKRYIGSSSGIAARWKLHRTCLRGNRHHSPKLQNAWNKYGESAFKFRVILTCAPTKEMLYFYEQQLFVKVKPEYNAAPVAKSVLGVKRSPETRARISKGNSGKVRTPEQNAAQSARMIGGTLTLEHRAKIGDWSRGKKQSPETIAKRAAKLRGQKRSPEICAAMSVRRTGVKLTPAHCASLSKARKGIPRGPMPQEQKDKISATKRAANLQRKLEAQKLSQENQA